MLRGGVMRRIGHSAKARDGRDEYQPAILAGEQVRKGRLRAVERGGQVGRDDPVPAFASHLRERSALGNAGIDDQHLDRPVQGARFLESIADLAGVGDVASDRRAAKLFGKGEQRLHPASENRDLGTGRMKVGRGRGADARASAGHHGMASLEPIVVGHGSPLSNPHWPKGISVARRRP